MTKAELKELLKTFGGRLVGGKVRIKSPTMRRLFDAAYGNIKITD